MDVATRYASGTRCRFDVDMKYLDMVRLCNFVKNIALRKMLPSQPFTKGLESITLLEEYATLCCALCFYSIRWM